MNENRNLKKGVGIHARRLIAYIVLIIVSIVCLFWFMYCLSMQPDQTVSYSQVLRWFRAAICGKTGRI